MSTALTPIRVETAFWLFLWVSLAAGIGLETDWGRRMQWPVKEIAETPPEFTKPVLSEPFRLPEPDQYLAIATRPIFVVTRRPAPPAPVAEAPKPSMKKDQFVLMGTAIVGQSKLAFLVEKAGNKRQVVAEGNEINGIMVKTITADQVVLSQHDDKEVLVLKTNKPAPAAGPGAAAGAPGAPPQPRTGRVPAATRQGAAAGVRPTSVRRQPPQGAQQQ